MSGGDNDNQQTTAKNLKIKTDHKVVTRDVELIIYAKMVDVNALMLYG